MIDSFLFFFCFYTHKQLFDNIQAQVAKAQWLLFVELHQFQNMYNATVKESFCCCEGNNCEAQAANLQGCIEDCDTWLNAYVSHCITPNACSFYTTVHTDSASVENFNDKFIFVLSNCTGMVSVNMLYIIIITSAISVCTQIYSITYAAQHKL